MGMFIRFFMEADLSAFQGKNHEGKMDMAAELRLGHQLGSGSECVRATAGKTVAAERMKR